MNPEHVLVFIRGTRVCVRDRPCRIVERQPVPMDPAGEVDIFRVHKEPLVKQAGFHHRFRAQHHETAAQVRCIDRTRQIEVP